MTPETPTPPAVPTRAVLKRIRRAYVRSAVEPSLVRAAVDRMTEPEPDALVVAAFQSSI